MSRRRLREPALRSNRFQPHQPHQPPDELRIEAIFLSHRFASSRLLYGRLKRSAPLTQGHGRLLRKRHTNRIVIFQKGDIQATGLLDHLVHLSSRNETGSPLRRPVNFLPHSLHISTHTPVCCPFHPIHTFAGTVGPDLEPSLPVKSIWPLVSVCPDVSVYRRQTVG